jgi:hypothetical protein
MPVQLWTFRGLDTARGLYERAGFVLQDERSGKQRGKQVVEQRFVRAVIQSKNES